MPTTTQRGYGTAHQRLRAQIAARIERQGGTCQEVICLAPTRTIPAGANWHLAHDRTTGLYRGEAHPRCNMAESARHNNPRRGRPRHSRQW